MEDSLQIHYRELAPVYDDMYAFFEDFRDDLSLSIIEILDLGPADVLADIGGGTGKWAERIKQLSSLEHDVITVDPIEEMTAIAQKRQGVRAITADAVTFVNMDVYFNKCVFLFCLHHIRDREQLFRKLRERKIERIFVALTNDDVLSQWLPGVEAHELGDSDIIHQSRLQFKDEAKRFGWTVDKEFQKKHDIKIPTEKMVDMILGKFASALRGMDESVVSRIVKNIRDEGSNGWINRTKDYTNILFSAYY